MKRMYVKNNEVAGVEKVRGKVKGGESREVIWTDCLDSNEPSRTPSGHNYHSGRRGNPGPCLLFLLSQSRGNKAKKSLEFLLWCSRNESDQ